jgi:hypothetical protein
MAMVQCEDARMLCTMPNRAGSEAVWTTLPPRTLNRPRSD